MRSPVEPATLKGRLRRLRDALVALGRRYPVASILAISMLSNLTATIFNITFNGRFVQSICTGPQKDAFWLLVSIYNPIAFPAGMSTIYALLGPVRRAHGRVLRGEPLPPEVARRGRAALVNLPFYLMCVNSLCWIPGMFLFPAVIIGLGGSDHAGAIWVQFLLSWGVGMALTVVQTLFFVEEFLTLVLYPLYFRDARPAETAGGLQIGFFWRLFLFWAAVALMPMVAVVVLASGVEDASLRVDLYLTVAGGLFSGGLISLLVGWSLWRWLGQHRTASERLARGELEARVAEQRPDEWGRLTDAFNDMAAALEKARDEHEVFGQFLNPKVRDAVLERYPGLEVRVQDLTVLFADIRGFTRRCAGEQPQRVGALLNRFLTLTLRAVEEKDGYVNKFLGDGAMALFGVLGERDDHADLAVACANELLVRLDKLNAELEAQGQAPLQVGVGIHSGPALVGCFGATLKQGMRREFTAIGATVNLCQRIEQLTKQCGGPILLSEQARVRLRTAPPLACLGPQSVPGCEEPVVVHRVCLG